MLAERHKSKDTIGVYDAAEEYKLARVRLSFLLMFSQPLMTSSPAYFDQQHYPLPTSYMSSLSLSPTGNHLAIWEGPMEVSPPLFQNKH